MTGINNLLRMDMIDKFYRYGTQALDLMLMQTFGNPFARSIYFSNLEATLIRMLME